MSSDIQPMGRPDEYARLLRWDGQGLIPVVVQDRGTGDVLMLAYADRAALAATLATRQATFFSRSRGSLWVKGAVSGYRQAVAEVRTDCDGDALLYIVDAPGPACHQLRRSCFSSRIDADGSVHCDRPVIA